MFPLLLLACGQDHELNRRTKTDVFLQEPMAQVDILWVIDNSHSMEAEQGRIAQGFVSFVSNLSETNIDFHIGVITTDMDLDNPDRALLLGHPAVLTPEDNYIGLFQNRVQVGIDGSDKEKGLSASLEALTEPLASGMNAGFLRDDATLSIIYVSDEDDCSDNEALAGQQSSACYTQGDDLVSVRDVVLRLKRLKPPGVRVLASGLVGPHAEADCEDTWPGHRYIGAAEATGGLIGDICADDYSSIMDELGLSVSGMLSTFELTYAAIEGSLMVTVDDVVIEEDPDTGWSYDPEYWLVRFDGEYLPPRGSVIHATYEIGGG